MKLKIIFSFLMCLIIGGMLADRVQANFNIPAALTGTLFFATVILAAFAKNSHPYIYRSDVDVQIWAREIIKRLRKDNKFLTYAMSENKYVVGGAAVLIPQPGSAPVVVKNRSSFPATAVRRSDTTVLYALDEYSTNPTHITLNELQSISYDKINDVISDNFATLLQDMGDDMLIKWLTDLPYTGIILTSGDNTDALESGQTGQRRAMTWKDLQEGQRLMNKANVSKEGRLALIEENMYQQFVDSLKATQYRDAIKEYDTANGTVGRLFGFDIMTRSSVCMAAAAAIGSTSDIDVNALGASVAADDNVACLLWQKDVVANATGTVNLFSRVNDPLYYGDVNSVSARMGGRRRRGDDLGVLAIVQAPAAGF